MRISEIFLDFFAIFKPENLIFNIFGLAMGCFQKPCQQSWTPNNSFLLVET